MAVPPHPRICPNYASSYLGSAPGQIARPGALALSPEAGQQRTAGGLGYMLDAGLLSGIALLPSRPALSVPHGMFGVWRLQSERG